MLKRGTIILFCVMISVFYYPVLASVDNDFSFPTSIQRYYDSWEECRASGSVNYDHVIYTLKKASVVEGTRRFKATYSIPEELKITYDSWEECKKIAPTLEDNNLIYKVVRFDRIGTTEKFLATYELREKVE